MKAACETKITHNIKQPIATNMPSLTLQILLAVCLLVALTLPSDVESCPRRVRGAFSGKVPKPPPPRARVTPKLANKLKRQNAFKRPKPPPRPKSPQGSTQAGAKAL
uniref:Secreted protein n=2 Tax=Macrostomum lignano TaxID=282301 RepID=A0A1I8JJ11_9PLAT